MYIWYHSKNCGIEFGVVLEPMYFTVLHVYGTARFLNFRNTGMCNATCTTQIAKNCFMLVSALEIDDVSVACGTCCESKRTECMASAEIHILFMCTYAGTYIRAYVQYLVTGRKVTCKSNFFRTRYYMPFYYLRFNMCLSAGIYLISNDTHEDWHNWLE